VLMTEEKEQEEPVKKEFTEEELENELKKI
jgi:hypothetical protein